MCAIINTLHPIGLVKFGIVQIIELWSSRLHRPFLNVQHILTTQLSKVVTICRLKAFV